MRASSRGVSLVSVLLGTSLAACGGSSGVDLPPQDGDAGASEDATTGAVDGQASGDAQGASDGTVGASDAADDARSAPDGAATDGASSDGPANDGAPNDAAAPTDAGGSGPLGCIPGQSVGCVGPGGCVSNQVCTEDGSGYGACACSSAEGGTLACVPGQSIACGGPNGCTSFQVCKSDGSGYAPCECPDAGNAVDSGVTGWTPGQLPGLALWLDDTYGLVVDPVHSGYVRHWLDKSGNGNDASLLGGPYGPGSQWSGFTIDPQTIGGRDAVTCPGDLASTFHLDESSKLDWGTGDFGIVMVVGTSQLTTRAPGTYWFGNGVSIDNSGQALGLTVGAQSISMSSPPLKRFNVLMARGQALNLAVNGAIATGPTNSATLAGSVDLCSALSTEIAEVIAVKGTLTDDSVTKINAYLKAKFNL